MLKLNVALLLFVSDTDTNADCPGCKNNLNGRALSTRDDFIEINAAVNGAFCGFQKAPQIVPSVVTKIEDGVYLPLPRGLGTEYADHCPDGAMRMKYTTPRSPFQLSDQIAARVGAKNKKSKPKRAAHG